MTKYSRRRAARAFLAAALLLAACLPHRQALTPEAPRPGITIALQPLGPVDSALVERVRAGIIDAWTGRVSAVELSPATALPQGDYYHSGTRLRACRLLWLLEESRPTMFDKLVALTAEDLSVTDGRYYPWNAFGVAWLGGRVALISTSRLKGPRLGPGQLAERLAKVVNHEVGHLLGIDHCSGPRCVMAEARASLRVLDNCSPSPCSDCLRRCGASTSR